MNPEIYGEWLRRQGQVVARTASTYWHSEGLGVYQAFPYYWLIAPSEEELSQLFYQHQAIAVRYSTLPDNRQGRPSYALVFEEQSYTLEGLGHRTRKNVRRGLRTCAVQPISFECLVEEAWDLRQDALGRQGRRMSFTYEAWRDRYLGAADLPGFEVWGARVGKQLAGYLVTFQMDDCICIVDHQSHREFLELNVNNAMTFVVSENALKKPGVRLLFYGLESLDAPARVSEFKFHMGYAPRPIRQRVAFHPYLTPLVNRFSHGILKAAANLAPGRRWLAKAEGMFRFSLAEKQSPNQGMIFSPRA